MANFLTYRLIADLLQELEREGHALSAGKLLQVQELLRRLPDDTPPERLRTLLSPLFATDAESQRRFYEQFEKSLAQAREVSETVAEEVPEDLLSKKEAAAKGERRWRHILLVFPMLLAALAGFVWETKMLAWYVNPGLWLSALALAGAVWLGGRFLKKWPLRVAYVASILLLGALGFWMKQFSEPPTPPHKAPRQERFAIAVGDTLSKNLLPPNDTAQLLRATPEEMVATPQGGQFQMDSTGMGTYVASAEAAVGSTDTLRALLHFYNRTDTLHWLADLIAKPEPPPPINDNLIPEVAIPYYRDIAELQVDTVAAQRFEWYKKYEWPLKALLALLLGALAWAIARWDQYRRAKVIAELQRPDRAPYIWNPETGADASELLTDVAQPLLNRLRGRALDERMRLDMPASIRATSRRAGRVLFIYRRRTLPPDFLLLIDRLGANDHRARLFDALYQVFAKAEAPVSRYFYDGDPRLCFDEAHPEGIALGELLHRHAGAQLFIIGEGQDLLSPLTGKAAPWTNLLEGWPRRALLSPRPLQAWGKREQQLQQLLPLLPASPDGLGAALDLFTSEDPIDTRDLLPQVRDALQAPFAFGHDLIDDLQQHFEPPVIDWIAACALWPALSWDLTLHLGNALSKINGKDLLNFEHLRELTRLPWFTEGRIPEGARAWLVAYLQERGLEAPLREALQSLLQQTPKPPKGSTAYDDYRMNLILNELLLKPDAATRRRLEREFARYLAAGKRPDFVALRLLDRPSNALDVLLSGRLKKFAFREGLPALGWRMAPKLLGIWAVLVLAVFAFRPNLNPCPGERIQYKDMTLCINNGRDLLLYLEMLAADAIEAQDTFRVDSLRQVADAIQPTDTFVHQNTIDAAYEFVFNNKLSNHILSKDTIFYQNTAARYYNYGARVFNCLEEKSPECATLPSDSLRAVACMNFGKGSALFTMLTGGVGFNFFNAMQRSCPKLPPVQQENKANIVPPPADIVFSGRVQDAATRKPIAGAEIRAGDANRTTFAKLATMPRDLLAKEGIAVSVTDAEGRYNLRFDGKAALVILEVRVTAAGYKAAEVRSSAQKGFPLIQLVANEKPKDPGQKLPDPGKKPPEENKPPSKEQEQISAEEAAWRAAQTADNAAACQRFLQQYPKSRYAEAAQRCIDEKTPPATTQDNGLPPNFPIPAMVRVQGGTFTMGCDEKQDGECEDNEKPAHEVTLSDFEIGKYEVTNEEYAAFLNEYRSVAVKDGVDKGQTMIKEYDYLKRQKGGEWAPERGREKYPVANVSWYGAAQYARWLSEKTGQNYRLPTEAEWEYAARGGQPGKRNNFMYSGSNNVNEVAWNRGDLTQCVKPVGQLKANELGIYDMSGNVAEWTNDWYSSYSSNAQTNPKGLDRGSLKVFRGGACFGDPFFVRCAIRYSPKNPDFESVEIGFRLARSIR